jgi:hypothetical protein
MKSTLKVIADIMAVMFIVAFFASFFYGQLSPSALRKGNSIFGSVPWPVEIELIDIIPMVFAVLWSCARYAELRQKYLFLDSRQFKVIIFPGFFIILFLAIKVTTFFGSRR